MLELIKYGCCETLRNIKLLFRTMAKPRMASHASRDRLVFKEPGVHSSDDEEEDGIGSEDGTSSNSSSHKHTSFDRHLVLVGKFSYQFDSKSMLQFNH